MQAQHVDFSYLGLWSQMGMGARSVVITLAIMSIYSLGVTVDRLFAIRKSKKQSLDYLAALKTSLDSGNTEGAISSAEKFKLGYLAKILSAGLREFKLASARPDKSREEVMGLTEQALEKTTARALAELKRGMGGLATIASTAPFVGLFGTVLGIITAFQKMAGSGSGGLGTVSAGIAEALLTTAFGLLVAIPAVMIFNYLTNSLEAVAVDIHDASSELLLYLAKTPKS